MDYGLLKNWKQASLGCLLGVGLIVAAALSLSDGPNARGFTGQVLWLGGSSFMLIAAAALWGFRCKQMRPNGSHEYLGPALIGASAFLRFIAEVTAMETNFHLQSLLVGITPVDLLIFGSYGCFCIGALVLIRHRAFSRNNRAAFDNLILAICAGVLLAKSAFAVLLSPIAENALDISTFTIYPLCVLCALWVGVTLLSTSFSENRNRLISATLTVGISCIGIADLGTTATRLMGDPVNTSQLNHLWTYGYLLLALAGFIPVNSKTKIIETQDQSLSHRVFEVLGSMLPYGVGIVTIALVAQDDLETTGAVGGLTIAGAVLFMLVFVTRQFVLLINKQREISQIAANLEQKVQSRTQKLEARYLMARAVSSSYDIEQFAESTLEHISQVFAADGFVFAISPGLVEEHPRGIFEASGFGNDILSKVEDEIISLDPTVTVEPTKVLVGDEWKIASVLQVPLRAMNEVYGAIIAVRVEESFSNEDRADLESTGLEIASALGHNVLFKKAVEASERDYLTETLNHRAVSQRLQQMISNPGEIFCIGVLVIDVGGFKLFNDTYGHAAGDDVLRCIAGRLKMICEPLGAYVGRAGGDEFILLLPNYSINDSYRVAAQIQKSISEVDFKITGYNEKLPLQVNIGVAGYPESGQTAYAILASADANLIEAKKYSVTIYQQEEATPAYETTEENSGSLAALDMMLVAINNIDSYTQKHSLDVRKYAVWIAEEVGCSAATIDQVSRSAMLHDVGKIAIPATILRKPGQLTDDEYELLKQHSSIGAMIVSAMPGLSDIVDGVRYHHERIDGKGYPDGLAGDDIPWLGRILAVADAFSAMTTDRPYRKGMDWTVAAGRIRQGIGTQFDPKLAEAFLNVLKSQGVVPIIDEDSHRKAA